MVTFNTITFKDEGEVNGEPAGSVVLSSQDDQDRSERWMTLREARALAADNNLELEEI